MPRFLLVSGMVREGVSCPSWPDIAAPLLGDVAPDGTWVSWRLTGSNHRELGRSVAVFPSVATTLTSVTRLRQMVGSLQGVVAASPRDARWTWRVVIEGTAVAASSRAYARNRECIYNLETFLAAVPVADVVDALPRHLPVRLPAQSVGAALANGEPFPVVPQQSEYAG